MVLTPEAPSRAITKDDVLRLIPQYEIKPIFKRPHLNREIVGGAIGDRGGGKSALCAVVGIVDAMLEGRKCYSNMKITCDLQIDDATARKYGLNSGGNVHYESLPLDKNSLLELDVRYQGSYLVIEEINVQYSNVRRFMTNTNVDFNEVCQQLRHYDISLIYNVIDEMFIDPQLRTLSDFFVRTYDTAFDSESLEARKPKGQDFKWKIYPISGYLAGEQKRYAVTKQALPAVYFKFAPWHGIFPSEGKSQKKGIYSMTTKDKNKALQATVEYAHAPDMVDQINEFEWLEKNVQKVRNAGIDFIEAHQLWPLLEIMQHGYTPQTAGKLLPAYGIHKAYQNKLGQWVFKVADREGVPV